MANATPYSVATVLLIERRKCRVCGMVFECPNEKLLEMYVTPDGTEYEKFLLPYKDKEVRYNPTHAVHIAEVEIETCHYCFVRNIEWKKAQELRPTALNGMKKMDSTAIPGLKIAREPTLEELIS